MGTRDQIGDYWKGQKSNTDAAEVAFLAVASASSIDKLIDLLSELDRETVDKVCVAAELAYQELSPNHQEGNL